ncbi:PLP-dependent aspartate aminotransferase family protein [Lactobacillus mulieris]|uniref:trans-sulfuration enzyme family protein n=1 Tax=Lactobacillus mulieris TaxID=2508708 RepID=UPI001432DFA9|nr:PLP-dependent aspartate aminotransferase family protein [Lactobacillus mulieris]MCF1784025.1 PLP-dependent aspartate aminotransferase family protein [Lactobacillus mulieris]MCW8104866.1 PLP-dependent aspartate aminotransferase family protein [Lactobacillus mulieris]MDK6803828.1 PLP-dependent aspartate aminotransferase family protein [Lactobacillus mulieris]MDK8383002.1 PLP-dependent aspartate aminotransferase family protein [Lactobacillus mulieris]MDT9621113.1 PLP-dependent aspartate aminot
MKFDSKLIHGGINEDEETGAVSMPIYRASTYHKPFLSSKLKWEYSRSGNPTRAALESLMADLEDGNAAFAFSSGSAAIHAVFSLLSAGDEVIIGKDVYGGTFRLANQVMKRFGLNFTVVDTRNLDEVSAAINSNVKAIYLETPTNPLLEISDLAAIAEIAQKHDVLMIVDNTFASPYNQKPLDLGADIVVHSGTKYLGGHSDLVAGIAVAKSEKIAEQLAFLQNSIGAVLSPDDSWLLMRGIKTLGARMRVHEDNAQAVVKYLLDSKYVKKVMYPGLETNPSFSIAKKQMKGFGAMISFELADQYRAEEFVNRLHMISLAESLGGIESLVEVPAVMTHGSIPREIRLKNGISDGLIRLSVGIEDKEDILADLDQAFKTLD